MEDSSRDLEKELKKYAVPNPFNRSGQWQMLLISEDGKMISVRRYKGIAMFVMVLLIISLLSTALFSVLYFRSLNSGGDLKDKVVAAEQETKALQEENERLEAMLFLADKNIKTDAPDEKVEPAAKEPPPPARNVMKKVEKMKAAVRDLTVTKDAAAGDTRIRFIVKNDCELKSIAGRVFVILKPQSAKAQDWLTMPPVTLKDGVPSMPSRGQFFSINNFKSVNFKFKNPLPDDHYKTMDVFIFSTDGDQVFKETYDIELIVINKPGTQPGDEEDEASETTGDTASGAADSTDNTATPAVAVAAEQTATPVDDTGSAQGESVDEP